MKYQIFKFDFLTGVHLGQKNLEDADFTLAADTVFSALCQEYMKTYDMQVESFVARIKNGKILLSDAFPYIMEEIYLPKPMLFIDTKENQGDSIIKKAYKKLKYIPSSQLEEYFSGDLDVIVENNYFRDFGKKEIRDNVSVRGMNEPQPYRTGIYHFSEGCGLYIIVAYENYEDKILISKLLNSLGYTGIGGKRNSGLGKFRVEEMDIPSEIAERLNSNEYRKYISLSVGLPRDSELSKALYHAEYKLIKRSGFVQSETYSNEQRRKKDLYVFQAGSTFEHKFSGDVYDVNSGGSHPVYRYAKPIFMGV